MKYRELCQKAIEETERLLSLGGKEAEKVPGNLQYLLLKKKDRAGVLNFLLQY